MGIQSLVTSLLLLQKGGAQATDRMKIVIAVEPSPFTYICGYSNRFQALTDYLDDQVEIVTTEVVAKDRPRVWKSVPLHYTFGVRCPAYPSMSLSVDWSFKLLRTLCRMRPQILHASSPGFLVLSAVFWGRLLQIPTVLSYHTHLPVYIRSYIKLKPLSRFLEWLSWKVIRIVHGMADLTIVTSPQIQEEFKRHQIPCLVWKKGIDTKRFHPKFRDEMMRYRMTSGHPNDFLLVYIGRLGSEKRLKELRDVLDRMPADTRLCFVGSGPQETELREYFASYQCAFTGVLTGEPLSQAFASADAFCFPSDSETLGFVVLESMASGVPVIGVRAGGVMDLIKDGTTGFLVNPGDTEALAMRVLELKNNIELRQHMAEIGRSDTEHWTWDASMANLRHVLYVKAIENYSKRWERCIFKKLRSCPIAEQTS